MRQIWQRHTCQIIGFTALCLAAFTLSCADQPSHSAGCSSDAATDLSREPDFSAHNLARWTTKNGCQVRLDVLMTRMESCHVKDARDLVVGTPLGKSQMTSDARVYVRDPRNGFGDATISEKFRSNVTLPSGATDTGYRQGETQLWVVPGSSAFVYLVDRERVERWPLDRSPPGCA